MNTLATRHDWRPALRRFHLAALSALLASACDLHAQKEDVGRSPEVKALVHKTLADLSHVQGGGFWLGDPGVLMTDVLKASGVALGPDATISGNPGYTIGEDNKPPRWVTLDSFSIQRKKVTYEDFDVYVAANKLPPHPPKGDEPYQRIWQAARAKRDVPVGVTWEQAKAYCQWLAKLTQLPFALPSEAQWEFAASNGRKTHREPMPLDTGVLEEGRNAPTHEQRMELIGELGALYPVGRFPPSKLGLHDLVGNGLEWVNDWYAQDAYQSMKETHNPTGPATGTEKVLRGKAPQDDLSFSGFPHVDRYHQVPQGKKFRDGRPIPYSEESFRCVVNQQGPVDTATASRAAP